jgi:hypothetical protein
MLWHAKITAGQRLAMSPLSASAGLFLHHFDLVQKEE